MKRKFISRTCPGCNTTKLIRSDSNAKHCRSCRAQINQINKKPKDLSGKKFNMLMVIGLAFIKKSAYWNCICDCGNKCVINATRLSTGHTKSCGCLSKTQNGLSTSPAYRSWDAMIQRCYDKKVPHYQRYGARGIFVCDEWLNSFLKFHEDMGDRPIGLTLDRIDSSKGYYKENCRWATPKDQSRHCRHIVKAFGKELSLIDWQKETGIRYLTIRKRIVDLKWDVETALTKKVRKNG